MVPVGVRCSNERVTDHNALAAVERDLSDVARVLFASGTVGGSLRSGVELAVQAVVRCDAAAVAWVRHAEALIAASSNERADALESLQRSLHEGPSADALLTMELIYSGDLARDVRYPRFGARTAEFGAASAMAVRLADHPRGGLCLYGREIDAFDGFDRAQAVVFAKMLGLALEVAGERADEQQRLANLHEALRTRELIGHAQGILIERERITADEAFNVSRRRC